METSERSTQSPDFPLRSLHVVTCGLVDRLTLVQMQLSTSLTMFIAMHQMNPSLPHPNARSQSPGLFHLALT